MYQLNDEEIATVFGWLKRERMGNRLLEQELLDHICSTMESVMKGSSDLEPAYKEACLAIYPNGALEIEEETFFLLNYNKQINMKRILFSVGFISTFLLSFGFLFKLMHWPMANILMLTSNFSLIITLVMLFIVSAKALKAQSMPMRVRFISGVVSGMLVLSGSIFKMLHYPGAMGMFVLGMVLLNIIFLPMFFYQLYRKSIA